MWATYVFLVALSFLTCSIYYYCLQDEEQVIQSMLETVPILELNIFTVATEETDGYQRFIRSAYQFNLDVEVLGMGQTWRGGDLRYYPGGGQKIHLYRKAVFPHRDRNDLIVMISDAYDVVFNANSSEIINRFLLFDAKVLFCAEKYCWPDNSLAVKYPSVKDGEKYLNSGLFMGYAADIYGILSYNMEIGDKDDDQLYFSTIYVDNELREKYKMKLDSTFVIFQNIYGLEDDVHIEMVSGKAQVTNKAHSTNPCIIHGNGPSKTNLLTFGNYLANSWNDNDGCISCREGILSLSDLKTNEYPVVQLSIFVPSPTPFLAKFFDCVALLNYPKDRIILFVYNNVQYHEQEIETWLQVNQYYYKESYVISGDDNVKEVVARERAIDFCLQQSCDYLFVLDAEAHLENRNTLTILVEQNSFRTIQAPLLTRPGKWFSNFWGALSNIGYYKRSDDYQLIITGERRGVWNVPYIRSAYLISSARLPHIKKAYSYRKMDADMSFCAFLRIEGYFFYVNNLHQCGHLVDGDNFDISKKHPNLFQIFQNEQDWNEYYLHEDYSKYLAADYQLDQPCPRVFAFPLLSIKFCLEMIEETEQWSRVKGKDNDSENVTIHIQMNQIGYERHMSYILKRYAKPVQEKVLPVLGHDDTASSSMLFVIGNKSKQSYLITQKHKLTESYTLLIALNRIKITIDFQGIGINCTVFHFKQGWSLIFPGQISHLHAVSEMTEENHFVLLIDKQNNA